MTTTIMKDSVVGDAWIQQSQAAVPIQKIIDPQTGNWNGDFLTGPVRLAFADLFELPKKKDNSTSEPKYGAHLLFPPNTNFQLLYDEYYAVAARDFADKWNPHMNQYQGVRSPFRDQAEKAKFSGYTPGAVFLSASSRFKPPVVDARRNPIIDPNKVKAGFWAICAINCYAYKDPKNPGIAFGLQSVMMIAEDKVLSGGGPDVQKQFAGVNVPTAVVRPDMAAGMPQATPPSPGIPGYIAPGGGAQTPGYNPGVAAPQVPQTHFVPPATPSDDDNDMSFLG